MNARSANIVLLVVNLGLLGTIGYLVFGTKLSPAPVRFVTKTEMVTNKITQIAVRKINATNFLAGLLSRPLNWSVLESTNYLTYITNLRNFGCPEETIQDIIITDIAKLYAQRRAALRALLPKPAYWQPPDIWGSLAPEQQEIRRQLRELDAEERELVKELLGVDYETELAKYRGDEEFPQPEYDFLPQEKRDQVAEVLRKFEDMESDFYARTRGLMLPEDTAELNRLHRQREAELAKLLTPEELTEYQLRNSDTAQSLRAQLEGFNTSEEEFRKIFQLQKVFDDTFSQPLDSDEDRDADIRSRAQREAQQTLDEEIKKALGDTRYAQYQRAQDNDYRTLLQLADRFELSSDVAGKVYDMKVAAEKQKQQVEENPNLSEDQRLAALLAIASETEKSVSQSLGDTVFKRYQSTGGNWIRRLAISAVPLPSEEDFLQ